MGNRGLVIYSEDEETFALLDMQERGKLITAMFDVHNGREPTTISGTRLTLIWPQFNAKVKHNNEKWERIAERNRTNGAKGGRPTKNINPEEPNGNPEEPNGNPDEPKETHSVYKRKRKRKQEREQGCGENIISFEDFWDAYPRKVKAPLAMRAWNAALKKIGAEEIMAALGRALEGDHRFRGEKKYVPHPPSWLNSEPWRDVLDGCGTPGGVPEKKSGGASVGGVGVFDANAELGLL